MSPANTSESVMRAADDVGPIIGGPNGITSTTMSFHARGHSTSPDLVQRAPGSFCHYDTTVVLAKVPGFVEDAAHVRMELLLGVPNLSGNGEETAVLGFTMGIRWLHAFLPKDVDGTVWGGAV